MSDYQFAFRTITQAQQAARALRLAGIPVQVHRTRGVCAGHICGFSAFVPMEKKQAAEAVFARQGIRPERGCEEGGTP